MGRRRTKDNKTVKSMKNSTFRKLLQLGLTFAVCARMYAGTQYNFVTFDVPGETMNGVVGISGNTIIGNGTDLYLTGTTLTTKNNVCSSAAC